MKTTYEAEEFLNGGRHYQSEVGGLASELRAASLDFKENGQLICDKIQTLIHKLLTPEGSPEKPVVKTVTVEQRPQLDPDTIDLLNKYDDTHREWERAPTGSVQGKLLRKELARMAVRALRQMRATTSWEDVQVREATDYKKRAPLDGEGTYIIVRSEAASAICSIENERGRQEQLKAQGKFDWAPSDRVNPKNGAAIGHTQRLAVLAEEYGEIAHIVCDDMTCEVPLDYSELRKELIQLASCCVAWVEHIDRDKLDPSLKERGGTHLFKTEGGSDTSEK